jgi:hypothetical protein
MSQLNKYKATINMVIKWLDANIDDGNLDLIKQLKRILLDDSRDLKEKIELALDPSITKKQIEDGDF